MEVNIKINKLWLYVGVVFALLLIIVAIVLIASRGEKEETQLIFETIEIAEWGKARELYYSPEPKVIILAMPQDVLNLDDTVSDSAQIKLQNLDYKRYFALGVYQGLKGTNMYGVEIQRIIRKGNVITISALFTERDPSVGAGTIMTSPYHIVKILRQGLNGKIEFILYANGKEVTRQIYTMPDIK